MKLKDLKKKKKVPLQFYLEPDLAEKLAKISKVTGQTKTALVRVILERSLEKLSEFLNKGL